MRIDRVTRLRRACADLAGFLPDARLTVCEQLARETAAPLRGGDAPPPQGGLFDTAPRDQAEMF